MLQTEDQLAPIILGVNLLANLPRVFRGTKFHLYITSNDEIKGDDWCYHLPSKTIVKYPNGGFPKGHSKKITATTDSSLKINTDYKGRRTEDETKITYSESLPQLPQSFIDMFVLEYNGGNIVGTVELEYKELLGDEGIIAHAFKADEYKLKISKDNTVIFKQFKESWSREEVIDLYHQYALECLNGDGDFSMPYDKWLEKTI